VGEPGRFNPLFLSTTASSIANGGAQQRQHNNGPCTGLAKSPKLFSGFEMLTSVRALDLVGVGLVPVLCLGFLLTGAPFLRARLFIFHQPRLPRACGLSGVLRQNPPKRQVPSHHHAHLVANQPVQLVTVARQPAASLFPSGHPPGMSLKTRTPIQGMNGRVAKAHH
jgi:hypothetical protein